MASINLSDSCLVDSMFLMGTEGKFEATKDEVEISPFVASHFCGDSRFTIVFTEDDRDALMALPTRELTMLSLAFDCEVEKVVETILPKKTFRAKKPKSTKKEVVEDE